MIDTFSRAIAKNTVTGKNSLKPTLAETLRILRAVHTLPPPEIAGSNDGHSVDDGTDKRPRPFVFDVFAEDDEGLVDDGQPPAKRWHRASSASSSVTH
jgi:hypothetical protein